MSTIPQIGPQLIDPNRRKQIESQQRAQEIAARAMDTPEGQVPCVVLGVGAQSVTVFPKDDATVIQPGTIYSSHAYYFKDAQLLYVRSFRAFGVPMVVEYVKKPPWYERLKEAKPGSWKDIPFDEAKTQKA